MNLFIKNMVCDRCKMAVQSELEKLGLHPVHVALGEVEIAEENIDAKKMMLEENLTALGFEILKDERSKDVEKIKILIVELVQRKSNDINVNLSDYLVQHIFKDYRALSHMFSEEEGISIEKYFILQKIEKVKELLMYGEMNLTEIAFALNYSSTAHLSSQFKKTTGFTPTFFKQLKDKNRKQLDDV